MPSTVTFYQSPRDRNRWHVVVKLDGHNFRDYRLPRALDRESAEREAARIGVILP